LTNISNSYTRKRVFAVVIQSNSTIGNIEA
jgi:hypothetical protein